MTAQPTHYEVLGVAPDADVFEVRRAYVTLARRHHPDRQGGDPERMRAINAAWATLGDPVRRRQYDLVRTRTAPRADPVRRSPVPDPNYDPYDDIDPAERHPFDERFDAFGEDDDDLGDHRPRVTVALPGWLAVLPVGLFAASVGMFCIGVLFGSGPIVAFAFMAFVISTLMFLASPFIALLVSRQASRPRSEDGEG